jgi:hypothetical protein
MTDAGAPSNQPNVSALVEALDQRARQAGSEGATNVLRGMLGSLAEALGSIEARLDRIEDNLEAGGAGSGGAGGASGAIVEQIQTGIAAFNARLGRLEEAFVQAVEDSGSGTESVVEQFRRSVEESIRNQVPAVVDLSPLDRRLADLAARVDALSSVPSMEPVDLGSLERRLDEVASRLTSPPPAMEPVDLAPLERRLDELGSVVDLSPLERRLDDLAARLDSLPQPAPPAPPPPPVDLGPLEGRLDDLRARVEAFSDRADPMPRVHQRLDELEQRLQPTPATDLGPVLAEVARLRTELDTTEIRSAIDALDQRIGGSGSGDKSADVIAAVERTNEQLRARVAALLSAQSAEVQRRMQQIDDHVAATGKTLDELRAQLEQRPTTNELRDQFADAVRREAELITQRVVSLTVLVESTRELLDEHVEDTSNSLGRKASEVGRRLAADFGLRGKKSSRPDPRELGRGGH